MPSQHSALRRRSSRLAFHANDIVVALRAKILKGKLAAGERIPTHVMIEKQFHSTPPTVAKALKILKEQGFLRTERRRGMYVADQLPHQSHYALAFEFPQDERLSQFYKALRDEAQRFESAGRHFSIFYEIGQHTDTDDYQRLLGFVRSHRLAGLIFAQPPHIVEGTAFLEEPGIPRVAIATNASYPGIPSVSPDLKAFVPKALADLAARGRQRIALLRNVTLNPQYDREPDEFLKEVAARKLTTRPYWIQSVFTDTPHHAHELVQLLFAAAPHERPDALIIRDDNLVEHATAGLVAAGVRVPDEVEVIAHTNFPWPTPSAVPVRRLGYDVRRLLELCVARVDALRRGERPRRITLLPAIFENETEKPALLQSAMKEGVRI